MSPSDLHVDAPPFIAFSAVHWSALSLILLTCLIFPKIARGRLETPMQRLLAGLLVLHIVLKTWLWIAVVGNPWRESLPLHLCDLADLMAAILLIRGGKYFYELVYFWGFSGTFQALLTPDIPWSWPHPTFFAYFFGHGLILVTAVYATWSLGMRPQPASILRAFLLLNAYALLVTPINLALDANYLYLMAKPDQPSLIDQMGPWPWYILVLEGLALLSFALYYAPFAAYDHFKGRRAVAPAS